MAIPTVEAPYRGTVSPFETNNQTTRVLLIEDNPNDALLVCSALADVGDRQFCGSLFDIHAATRLSVAIDWLAEKSFDVILLDLSLPDSQGFEHTFSAIREHAGAIPVIVLTGLGDESLGLKMVRAGAQDYLIKSRVERYVLVKAIRYALERGRSEQALRKSEEAFRSIVETTREWIWSIDLRGYLKYSNPAVETILGYKPEDLVGRQFARLLHPQTSQSFKTQIEDAIFNRRGWSGLVLKWLHKDGSLRWLESNSVPVYGADGELVGFRGSDRDITERELARSAHADLRLRLISAQEEERHRISRELHDQMGQSIVALMLGLKSLAETSQPTKEARSQFQQLQNLAGEMARDVHSLALELRPTALNDLGLEVALSNYLAGWSTRWQIAADFHSHGLMDRRLAPHLETNIYRIAQEALTNIVRHAKARNVSVLLERAADRVVVIIEDDGCGFDVGVVMKNSARERRLGLLGMEERVALVGGSLTIESTPGQGTTVYVRIPVSFQTNGGDAQWKS